MDAPEYTYTLLCTVILTHILMHTHIHTYPLLLIRGGGILFAPRKAYGNLMRIVRGEGEEDMHEFVELAESRL